jgi:hypothetical protein
MQGILEVNYLRSTGMLLGLSPWQSYVTEVCGTPLWMPIGNATNRRVL